jgi:two-component system response regulator YesN
MAMFQLLIVDDEESTVEALAVSLPREELEIEHVYKAYSSDEALRVLETHNVDILITDIQMPEENGLQLIKKVNAQYKGIKCILLTGHAEFEYAKEAIGRNIVDYLLKPIKDQLLFASIRKAQEQLKQEWGVPHPDLDQSSAQGKYPAAQEQSSDAADRRQDDRSEAAR